MEHEKIEKKIQVPKRKSCISQSHGEEEKCFSPQNLKIQKCLRMNVYMYVPLIILQKINSNFILPTIEGEIS
jgi:hypothetical protein